MARHRRTRAAALALASLLGLFNPGPAAHAQTALSSGPLTITIEPDPIRLTFSDARGTVLQTHSTETFGFVTPTGRYHATRATALTQDGATLATDDPTGRTIDLRIRADGNGIIALTATVNGAPGTTQSTIGFDAQPGERYLGFGERSNAVDQRGNSVENFVSDGP